MEFLKHTVYEYKEIASMIAEYVLDHSRHVIALTGTSGVGKSTFSQMIAEQITSQGFAVQIISVDNYLKSAFRAGTNFWNRLDGSYLKPEHFDWEALCEDLGILRSGSSIDKSGYIRGTGWGTSFHYEPSDYYILEGLFLDSILASESMNYDLVIALTAEDSIIRSLRIQRDAYYRKTSKTFKRTEEETLREIENTLRAGKSYSVFPHWEHSMILHAQGAYNATIHIKNL